MLLRQRLGEEGLDGMIGDSDNTTLSAYWKEAVKFIYDNEADLLRAKPREKGEYFRHIGIYFREGALCCTPPSSIEAICRKATEEKITYTLIYPLGYAELFETIEECPCCKKKSEEREC